MYSNYSANFSYIDEDIEESDDPDDPEWREDGKGKCKI